jgi:5-formyltetrahydrofolate cyclo-ligase
MVSMFVMTHSTPEGPIRATARQKADLRTRVLARRARLPERERAAKSAAIRAHLQALPEVMRARTVIGYAAFGAEVDVDPLLDDLALLGRGVFLPFVEGPDLGIARVADLATDLAPGYRGVREPKAIGRRPANPQRCEVAIVPGVAFDRHGGRLGYGGGHFDRLLARLRPSTPVVAVAFGVQLVEAVPREPHDIPMDVVVTEEEALRVTR